MSKDKILRRGKKKPIKNKELLQGRGWGGGSIKPKNGSWAQGVNHKAQKVSALKATTSHTKPSSPAFKSTLNTINKATIGKSTAPKKDQARKPQPKQTVVKKASFSPPQKRSSVKKAMSAVKKVVAPAIRKGLTMLKKQVQPAPNKNKPTRAIKKSSPKR